MEECCHVMNRRWGTKEPYCSHKSILFSIKSYLSLIWIIQGTRDSIFRLDLKEKDIFKNKITIVCITRSTVDRQPIRKSSKKKLPNSVLSDQLSEILIIQACNTVETTFFYLILNWVIRTVELSMRVEILPSTWYKRWYLVLGFQWD